MSEVRAQGHQLVTRARRGPAGTSAIWLDLNNENDSILYDGDGNKLSDNVVSTAKLYDGGVDVTSLVANWSLSLNGCSGSNAANVITITALSAAAATATLSCTYKSQTFSIVLSIKKIVGTVKYDLVVTPDAVAYNTTTGDKSSDTINVKIYRTAQNNNGGVTRQLVADIPSGCTLQVDGTNVNSASYDSGYTFNVNVSRSSHVVSLLKGSVIEDSETIPINKSTNGTNGQDGNDGNDGTDGDGIIEVFMWSPTKPSAPTGTSKTPSGWSDSPNRESLTFTYRNEGDAGTSSFLTEGIYRRNPKILDNETIAERVKFTTTKANQNIYVDIHADTEGASYDYLAVGRLDNASWTSSPLGKVGGTNGNALVQVAVSTPGDHFIIIGYRKDSSISKGKDYGWYRFVTDENLNCWFSRGVVDGATGTVKSWSDPLRYYADSVDEESVYLLADSTATPDTPISDAYTDDFIPPRTTNNYNGTQNVVLNTIVMYNGRAYKTIVAYSAPSAYDSSKQYIINERFTYQGEAYRCKQSCPSSGIDPSNTTYFEVLTPANNTTNFMEVPTWTDNQSDVSATYRYQFISERKKTNGAWGAFSTPRLYNTAGITGIQYRTTYWQTNVEYRNDQNSIDADPRIIDIATNMPMAFINDPNFKAYQCVRTHTSSNNIPLGLSGYWQEVNTMSPIVTAFILASSIKAQYIDVADLASNTAFINALTVKHLNAADGMFSGVLQFPFVSITEGTQPNGTAGGGNTRYYKLLTDGATSIHLPATERGNLNPYSSVKYTNYLELPTNMPDGVIVNIIGDGTNYKNILGDFHLHLPSDYYANGISYATLPTGSYMGNSIATTHELIFPNVFFIRLMSFNGMWYVIQVLGEYSVQNYNS